jgi:hypothetical protein
MADGGWPGVACAAELGLITKRFELQALAGEAARQLSAGSGPAFGLPLQAAIHCDVLQAVMSN